MYTYIYGHVCALEKWFLVLTRLCGNVTLLKHIPNKILWGIYAYLVGELFLPPAIYEVPRRTYLNLIEFVKLT